MRTDHRLVVRRNMSKLLEKVGFTRFHLCEFVHKDISRFLAIPSEEAGFIRLLTSMPTAG
jgi:hypothetical protein